MVDEENTVITKNLLSRLTQLATRKVTFFETESHKKAYNINSMVLSSSVSLRLPPSPLEKAVFAISQSIAVTEYIKPSSYGSRVFLCLE